MEILQDNETESGNQIGNQVVSLELLSGDYKGNTVEAVSSSSYLYGAHCEPGMRVIAEVNESDDSLYVTVYSYDRTWMLYAIVLLFLVTLCVIGGKQGFNSAVALVFTFVCIVFLFLPMIYRGISPIFAAIVVAVLTTFVTMYLIGGISSKSVTSMIGTVAGVGISGLLAVLFGRLTQDFRLQCGRHRAARICGPDDQREDRRTALCWNSDIYSGRGDGCCHVSCVDDQ